LWYKDLKKNIAFGLTGVTKNLIQDIIKNNVDVNIDYIYVDKEYKKNDYYENIPIIDDLNGFEKQNCIITAANHKVRKKWFLLAEKLQMNHLSIIDKENYIAKNVIIGKGCIIGQKNIIESDVVIGDYFMCGYDNRIGHDTIIGDYCHIYIKANIGGYNKIGNNVTVSGSSCLKEYTKVGDNVVIAMGAVVFNDINDNYMAIGNPAKNISL
jgi:sugar O-acyltransferase (sialic acid O-acetyltransferase NeuD family)